MRTLGYPLPYCVDLILNSKRDLRDATSKVNHCKRKIRSLLFLSYFMINGHDEKETGLVKEFP